MRVHDIKLKMSERFDAPKEAHTKPSGDAHIKSLSARAGFCDRGHSARNVLGDRFDANGPMAKYFHDETEYCDEEAAFARSNRMPARGTNLCVYAKLVKLWSSRPRHRITSATVLALEPWFEPRKRPEDCVNIYGTHAERRRKRAFRGLTCQPESKIECDTLAGRVQ